MIIGYQYPGGIIMMIIGYKYHEITKQLTMSEHGIKLSKLNVCNGGSSHANCTYM